MKKEGFTACGVYYEMGEIQQSYIEYCQNLLEQITGRKIKK